MPEVLIILHSSTTTAQREAILHTAPATQSISSRVFLATVSDAALRGLRSAVGVARVLTGRDPAEDLPPLEEAESLFVQAWLSRHGERKQRRGEGLDWDTPPMLPPDPKRQPG